jgi:hypothetical protein
LFKSDKRTACKYIQAVNRDKYEMPCIYINALMIIVGGFTTNNYWSSSEISSTNSWNQNFNDGNQNSNNKSNTNYVRAIRDFEQGLTIISR